MFPPHHYGGYELFARDVLSRFRDTGDAVEVLTSGLDLGSGASSDDGGLTVHRELSLYWADHVILRPPIHERWRMERRNHRLLQEHLDQHRPDVVSVWAMGCLSLGLLEHVRAKGIPVVLVVCDDWLVYGPLVDGWVHLFSKRPWAAPAARLLTRLPTRVGDLGQLGPACFTSDATKASAANRTPWRFPLSTVVYSGIDETVFPVATHDPPVARPWRWKLAVVGRLDPRKGVDTAIRALPLLPDEATLTIVGPGDERELTRLSALAISLGVDGRVHFEVAERVDLPARYRETDVLIFPVIWDEPFGLTPLEAMACDTPVVGTATGGSAEFLRDEETCLHFPPGDPRALAGAVRRLADEPDLRQRLVSRGRVVAAELTVANAAASLRQWHEAAATSFRDGPPAPRRTPAEVLDGRP